ncbi:MAG: PEPxxWA-CTERM sorting domain-containing protein [Sphingomonadaceae bacterium]|nr:PEPxxWA-CTERM sorting domain-containing protein [Thermaurantiacus sp.]MCS6986729.1 PEPxxWA-CTERM sorting domain-containing protein [Sphingomonadaceae bacterium]MDW8414008.1 PEPxxWA-CTERM sorting domain-containing protein [Thermaurantiacus sp.]
MQMGVYRGGLSTDPAVVDERSMTRTLQWTDGVEVHQLGTETRVRGVSGGFTSIPDAPTGTVFTFDLTVELDPGLELVDFVWRFATNSIVSGGSAAGADAEYDATFRVLEIAFLNAAGRNIGHTLDIRFPSGNVWPVAYIPEPETWAMLIPGFGLVGAAARRRRPGIAA